jgi:hypothetical protein
VRSNRADLDTVTDVLTKVLVQAQFNRIPRHPVHRDILLATLALAMRRRYPYSELELNGYLQQELSALRSQVDHVTCRRYLVDLGFIKRDRAGTRYFLNYPKIESALADEAIAQVRQLARDLLDNQDTGNRPSDRRGSPACTDTPTDPT